MNTENNSPENHVRDDAKSGSSKELKCLDFRELKNWQVAQYRKAVDENRWYLSQRYNRCVGWHEAEQDFLEHGYYGCAEKWRIEYCGEICPIRSSCPLAAQLREKAEEITLPKTG